MMTPLPLASQSVTVGKSTTIAPSPTIMTEILITITPHGFVPDVIMIEKGTKITWVNKSGYSASIASPTNYAPLNLGSINLNNSVSLIFTTKGRYSYANQNNPSETGTIIVE
jgi:plastocyanin